MALVTGGVVCRCDAFDCFQFRDVFGEYGRGWFAALSDQTRNLFHRRERRTCSAVGHPAVDRQTFDKSV
jgi:hypothetical protein